MLRGVMHQALSSENMLQRISPLGGYRYGRVVRLCRECDRTFHGRKDATQCLPCAVSALKVPLMEQITPAREIVAGFILWHDPAYKPSPGESLEKLLAEARRFMNPENPEQLP